VKLPPMPRLVTVETPSPPSVDPATGLETRPLPTVTETRAWLGQNSVIQVGNQDESTATQHTTISSHSFLCPLSVPLTSDSEVVDETGARYRVIGNPASRPDHRPQWRAAALQLISDMQ
jgi:hypothetical protein